MTSRQRIEKESVIDNHWRCFLCQSEQDLELHHCLHGSYRKLADKDGLIVALCRKCHQRVHDHGGFDKDLQGIAQRAYIKSNQCTREDFLKRYGKYFE